MIGMHPCRSRVLVLAGAILLIAMTAPLFAEDEDRGKMSANSAAERLVIHSAPVDDTGLELRLQPLTGSFMLLASDGQSVSTSQGTRSLVGFGASPELNDSGAATFMAGFSDELSGSDDIAGGGQGLFHVTRTGTLTLAVQAFGAADGTALGGDTICSVEPTPAINDSGQIAFGFNSDASGGAEVSYSSCANDKYASDMEERSGVGRWTSPSTLIRYVRSGQSISVGSPFRGSTASYEITDVAFRHFGSRVFNDSGQAVTEVMLDDDFTDLAYGAADNNGEDPDLNGSDRTYADDRTALLFLSGADTYELIAATGPDSIFQEVEHPTMNNSGMVAFKGVERTAGATCGYGDGNCTEVASSLNLWDETDGLETVADTETGTAGIPSSPDEAPAAIFQGISPLYQLNNAGQLLFSSGLTIAGEENDGDDDEGDYRVVILRDTDGDLVTVAATTAADTAAGNVFPSSAEGFEFDIIGASTILTESGAAFFIAETYEGGDNPCTTGVVETDWEPDDDGETTAVVRWTEADGFDVVLREGGLYQGHVVMAITNSQPHLRDHSDDGGRLFLKIVLDTDDDCDNSGDDPDDTFGIGVAGDPLIAAQLDDIPALSLRAILLLCLLLAAAALFMMRLAA